MDCLLLARADRLSRRLEDMKYNASAILFDSFFARPLAAWHYQTEAAYQIKHQGHVLHRRSICNVFSHASQYSRHASDLRPIRRSARTGRGATARQDVPDHVR